MRVTIPVHETTYLSVLEAQAEAWTHWTVGAPATIERLEREAWEYFHDLLTRLATPAP